MEVIEKCSKEFLINQALLIPKRFWPFQEKDLFELLKIDNITLPRPGGSILQLGNDLVTTYQFREPTFQLIKEYQQLEVLSKLNSTLEFIYDTIISQLPVNFLAVHIRLEQDMMSENEIGNNQTNFKELIHFYIHRVQIAFEKAKDQGTPLSPIVYMSSGLFHQITHYLDLTTHSKSHFRPREVIRAFFEAGFQPIWGENILSLPHQTSLDASERFKKAKILLNSITAEQRALIDLFICKKANAFVGSHKGSSFTYVVIRWRQYEKSSPYKEMEQELEKEISKHFTSWGLRN